MSQQIFQQQDLTIIPQVWHKARQGGFFLQKMPLDNLSNDIYFYVICFTNPWFIYNKNTIVCLGYYLFH